MHVLSSPTHPLDSQLEINSKFQTLYFSPLHSTFAWEIKGTDILTRVCIAIVDLRKGDYFVDIRILIGDCR